LIEDTRRQTSDEGSPPTSAGATASTNRSELNRDAIDGFATSLWELAVGLPHRVAVFNNYDLRLY